MAAYSSPKEPSLLPFPACHLLHTGVLLQDPLFWSAPLSHWCLCGSVQTLFLRSRGWASTSFVGLRGTAQHIPTLIYRPPGQNRIQTLPWISAPIPACRLHRPMPHPSQFVFLTLSPIHTQTHIYTSTHILNFQAADKALLLIPTFIALWSRNMTFPLMNLLCA